MDLRQLEILRAVAETGSFTRAGRRLHVSQSAISRQILLLEEHLKERLFVRLGRQVQITPAGEALVQLAGRVFADIRETCASISDSRGPLAGSVTLVGGMTVCLFVFPTLIREFRRHHPHVDIRIAAGGTQRLIRRLRAGRADLALLTLPIDEPGLTTVPMLREEMLLIMPPDHPLASGPRRVDAGQLVGESFIVFEGGSNTRRAVDDFFLRAQIKPKVVAETENAELIKALVRSGLGMSIVPLRAVTEEVRTEALAYARIKGYPLVRETGWVYRSEERVPRPLQEMMATLTRLAPSLNLPENAGQTATTPTGP